MVKVYCGAHVGGVFAHGGTKLPPASVDRYLLDTLLLGTPLPLSLGLYFCGQLGDEVRLLSAVAFRPGISPVTNQVVRLDAMLYGLWFSCSVRPAHPLGLGVVDGGQHHPNGIEFRDGARVRSLDFNWS